MTREGVAVPNCFSALQRAENSQFAGGLRRLRRCRGVSVLFSEPKILNTDTGNNRAPGAKFQCSSASRKFSIGRSEWSGGDVLVFQCSSASRKFSIADRAGDGLVEREFQCSSASRKFSIHRMPLTDRNLCAVSVLFSEPKILNLRLDARQYERRRGFSALQRAENSQYDGDERGRVTLPPFQCSSASRKFSM